MQMTLNNTETLEYLQLKVNYEALKTLNELIKKNLEKVTLLYNRAIKENEILEGRLAIDSKLEEQPKSPATKPDSIKARYLSKSVKLEVLDLLATLCEQSCSSKHSLEHFASMHNLNQRSLQKFIETQRAYVLLPGNLVRNKHSDLIKLKADSLYIVPAE